MLLTSDTALIRPDMLACYIKAFQNWAAPAIDWRYTRWQLGNTWHYIYVTVFPSCVQKVSDISTDTSSSVPHEL